jgi:predicted dinucleotide-binding enzyme
MKIGIIGAGNIGGNLTRRFTSLGHEVTVANSRGPETLFELVEETKASAVPVTEAAKGAEVLVVTIPEKSVPELPTGVLDSLAPGAVVIDTGNYYPRQRDGRIEPLESGTVESVWVSEQLGHPVVKAFNGIYASHLLTEGKPAGSPGRIALPVAGDDPSAKAVVIDLLDQLGFDGWTPVGWRNPGASSQGLPSTVPTSTPTESRRPWPKPALNDQSTSEPNRDGSPPRPAKDTYWWRAYSHRGFRPSRAIVRSLPGTSRWAPRDRGWGAAQEQAGRATRPGECRCRLGDVGDRGDPRALHRRRLQGPIYLGAPGWALHLPVVGRRRGAGNLRDVSAGQDHVRRRAR